LFTFIDFIITEESGTTPCPLVNGYVSDEFNASIFRVYESSRPGGEPFGFFRK
jgi:hypothetical protein